MQAMTRVSCLLDYLSVEMLSDEKIANIENGGKALDTLRELHKKAWDEFNSLEFDNVEAVKESKKNKKEDKKEDKKEVEESNVILEIIRRSITINTVPFIYLPYSHRVAFF